MNERERERERERRINGRHSGKPPAKSTCDRFISLLEALAFNVNGAGNREYRQTEFFKGKIDSRTIKTGKISEPPELVISWDTTNIFFILR